MPLSNAALPACCHTKHGPLEGRAPADPALAGRGLEGCSAILPASLPAAQESAAAPALGTQLHYGNVLDQSTAQAPRDPTAVGVTARPSSRLFLGGAGVCCPWRRYETAHSKAVTLAGKGSPRVTAPAGSGRFCFQPGSPTQRRLIK